MGQARVLRSLGIGEGPDCQEIRGAKEKAHNRAALGPGVASGLVSEPSGLRAFGLPAVGRLRPLGREQFTSEKNGVHRF